MIFRRPELEKDNPIAPQPYIGPSRRLAMARAAAAGESIETGEVRETLQRLAEAAARVVNRLATEQKAQKDIKSLRAAIALAERVLAVDLN